MKAYPIMFKHPTTGAIIENQGMELRDWFAAQAMMAFISTREFSEDDIPGLSFQMADWMIKQREVKDE